jgi:hypothetical protein
MECFAKTNNFQTVLIRIAECWKFVCNEETNMKAL